MEEFALGGCIDLVGTYSRNTSIDYVEWHGVLAKHETHSYEATIETVWLRDDLVSDKEITHLFSKEELETFKTRWEEHLNETDPSR